ncbi:MAG TPA: O-antigen polymerase [Pyrinomonadaceae bacterium]|nr:O-antigen polymerase [Pyrinomonadaceae bacterium]
MATALRKTDTADAQRRFLLGGALMMGIAAFLGVVGGLLSSDLTASLPFVYLLPWIFGLLALLATPTLILHYRGRLTLYDPLVFATWSYFFPAFVIGGLMLTAGWSDPYYLTFIQDAEFNLPYTIALIMLGFAGLAAGYFTPFGVRAGAAVSRIIPRRDFDSSVMLMPGLFLLILGTFNTIGALIIGVIGYQRSDAIESYDGIVFLTTLFWMQGSFILWYVIFKRGTFDVRAVVLVSLLLLATIGKALISGNRASLLQVFIIVILAFLLSGRRLNFRRTVFAGIILSVCLIAGMIYGTTFRHIKGTEAQTSIEQYTENIFETIDQVGKFDVGNSLQMALLGLAERLDTLSSVAVVVSNYEQLAPYEESYGLDNNIWKDLSTFFIPRILWDEKPIASEPRKYSDLYFDYGDNSFAITPIGDLLRNYGPVGVPIGMFLFGIIIRFIYRSLIEDQPRTIWRATMYFMLLMAISYEAFYGLLIPFLFKVGLTAAVGLLIVGVVARLSGFQRTDTPN